MTDKQQLETRLKYLILNRSTTANSRFVKAGIRGLQKDQGCL